jgi:hypothetical protein
MQNAWTQDVTQTTIIDQNDNFVARTYSTCDAKLIAAAPDLLEACKTALDNLAPAYSRDHLVIKLLQSAIAKATGK